MELSMTVTKYGTNTPGIPESIDGLDRADLAAFVTCLPGAEFSLRSGSVGKGAAGVGATLVVLLERALSDGANLVEVGAGLWSIIHAVRKKRGADPTVSDPTTLGALAAAAVEPPVRDLIVGCTYEKTVPLTVSYEHWAGTDDRDVWATCFSSRWICRRDLHIAKRRCSWHDHSSRDVRRAGWRMA